MSEFEPSPRSSKRRKVAKHYVGSAKTKTPSLSSRSIPQTTPSISRRLFGSRDMQDDLESVTCPTNVEDSAYGSKEDSLNEGDSADALNAQLTEDIAAVSDSPDELTQSGITVTPTKSQRNIPRRKEKTPQTAEKAAISRRGEEKHEKMPVGTRSSGRERTSPRRFSSSWDDTSRSSLPKGVLTPSRKGNRTPRKSVAFEKAVAEVEEDLGFKDLDKAAEEKTKRRRSRQKPALNDGVRGQVDKDLNQTVQGNVHDEDSEVAKLQDDPVPDIPELPDIATTPLIESAPEFADSRLDPVKSLVLTRLTGQTLTPLTALEAEYNKLHSLLLATVNAGEGNSILLLGSRGVGKTCLVETAVVDLAIEHGEKFHVVRLNGFIQTDDKLALREIWRQLGREMQVEEDETAQVNTYADTMASLLHLLSHPEELAETLEPDTPARTTKSVIFVLDEFDLFTTHPRQTLLYNLFDIAQARKAPIAVIGCSARVDVSDNLEKRVKSRFSHRWIHLSQAKSFPAFEEIAKAALMIGENDTCHERQSISSKMRIGWNAFIEVRNFLYSKDGSQS
jgi:origin recognition complex subunit 4